jgi:uncharacterized membrane protein
VTGPAIDSGSSTGLNSHLAAVLAYLFGCISGIVLLLVERRDQYVRFHAMQSTLTFLALLVATLIVGSVPVVGRLLTGLLTFAACIVWLVLMFKAFTGQRYRLPYIGEVADRQIR